MTEDASRGGGARSVGRLGDVLSSFTLSYGVAIALLFALVYVADPWNIVANTRLLDPLVEGGIVRYHDMHLGIVDGVDQQKRYLYAMDVIDWRLVGLAALVYFLYWGLKGIKFNGVARFVGLETPNGVNARARLYGAGLARFMPFRFGEAATTAALEAHGADPAKVGQAFSVVEFLTVVFQIGVFWLFGLFVTNYGLWFEQSMWAFVILGLAYLVARGTGISPWGERGYLGTMRATYRALADRPSTFAKLGGISMLLMLLDDVTPFLMAMAFTGEYVVLQIPFFVIQSGVVAGYIARRVEITPLGIGQWEWAFTLALYVSGVGFPEAACVALLDSAVRHGTGLITFLIVTLRYGVDTNFSEVLRRYTGASTPARGEPAAAAVAGAAS